MPAEFVGALDQGTTSSRFMVFDAAGRQVAVAQREHRQLFPRPGWVEHNPVEIWTACREVIERGLASAGLAAADLAAVGITNQRETTVVWDRRSGRPVHNAIVWQDTRTEELCARLAASGGRDRFRAATGLPVAAYFSGPKLAWILDNVDGARQRAEGGDLLFGTIDSWCIWNLTGGADGGVHVTDVTNAGRTLLMNIATLGWDEKLLSSLGIPPQVLPEIRASSEVYATAAAPLAGVPVASAIGDQHAALFGQTCFAPGDAKNTYGTGCFLLMNTGMRPAASRHGLLTTLAYQLAGQPAVYALEGSIAVAGALVQWVRDNLGLIESSAAIEALARSVDDNGGVYFVPAFSGLFAPHWRGDARGAILGLTAFANRGHLARAVLEATAWQTREVVDAMNADSGMALTELRVDGGMVGNELLMQTQADVLGVPVIRPAVTETTALGAAYAAGLATGFWRSLDELRNLWTEDRRWSPSLDQAPREAAYAQWQKAVARTLDWV